MAFPESPPTWPHIGHASLSRLPRAPQTQCYSFRLSPFSQAAHQALSWRRCGALTLELRTWLVRQVRRSSVGAIHMWTWVSCEVLRDPSQAKSPAFLALPGIPALSISGHGTSWSLCRKPPASSCHRGFLLPPSFRVSLKLCLPCEAVLITLFTWKPSQSLLPPITPGSARRFPPAPQGMG